MSMSEEGPLRKFLRGEGPILSMLRGRGIQRQENRLSASEKLRLAIREYMAGEDPRPEIWDVIKYLEAEAKRPAGIFD